KDLVTEAALTAISIRIEKTEQRFQKLLSRLSNIRESVRRCAQFDPLGSGAKKKKTPKPKPSPKGKTPTPKPSSTPPSVATATPTSTMTVTPISTSTPIFTPTAIVPTVTPTFIPTTIATSTPTSTPTLTATPTATPTSSPIGTTPQPTTTATSTPTPSSTPTSSPTATSTPTQIPTGPALYVAPLSTKCNPTNPGSGTLADPFTNLYYAAMQLDPGDTLYLRGGSYQVSVPAFAQHSTPQQRLAGCDNDADSNGTGYDGTHTVLPLLRSGTASQPITITNYPGETVVVDGTDADLASATWTRCESATQCGSCTGLNLSAPAEIYYTTDINAGSSMTPQFWVNPTSAADPGERLKWNGIGCQALSDLDRGEFSPISPTNYAVRLPNGQNPASADMHMSCQMGDCATHPIVGNNGVSYVNVRKNAVGGGFYVKYGYYGIFLDQRAHHLTFNGIHTIAHGGRDYGFCIRTPDGDDNTFMNGVCREVMGEGVGFYGGGPGGGQSPGIQIARNRLINYTISDSGKAWLDGGFKGNSLGMGVVLKNCDACEVRNTSVSGTFRDGIWVTTSDTPGMKTNNIILDGNSIANNCFYDTSTSISGIADCGCIQLEPQGGNTMTGATIQNNTCRGDYNYGGYTHTAASRGILIDQTIPNVKIINNSIRNVGGPCIDIRYNNAPVVLRNNIMDQCSQGSGGWCNGFRCDLMTNPTTIHNHSNNTFWAANANDLVLRTNGGAEYSRSTVNAWEASAVQQQPNWAGATDFQLVSPSAQIDGGTNTDCPALDHAGKSRPQNSICDIGAFEF
ncbi:right-handed parallel beta-helix repeat-containing protein, partial [Oligoflexia bacterium]|nr:right-handed parallel beta-helix repeat-containing protein [Oligoflexia bacterium]